MQSGHASTRINQLKYTPNKLVFNQVNNWKDLRKGHWPRLSSINIEDNKATSTRWLNELEIKEKMEMLCVESVKVTQNAYDYCYCAKWKVVESADICMDLKM